MNKDTEVRVRTPVGHTDYCIVGETLGQGTSESGIISATSLSGGVGEHFADSRGEANYAGLPLSCCLYQDDIARLVENGDNVRDGNKRLEEMANSKLLDFNE